MYLYTAMAHLAAELGDDGLRIACERLWKDVTESRMYVTAGFGPSELPGRADAELGLRPEHCHLSVRGDGALPGRVRLVERMGSQTLAHVETAFGTIAVQGPGHMDVTLGNSVNVGFDTSKAHVFGAAGAVL
jgi:ABC-type sugar transport system ATPase subunit